MISGPTGSSMIAITGPTQTKKLRNSTIIGVSATPPLSLTPWYIG